MGAYEDLLVYGSTDRSLTMNELHQVPVSQLSPGPWHFKEHCHGRSWDGCDAHVVFVVLDANDKAVAECERGVDAEAICGWRNALVLGPGSTGYNEGADAAVDWSRYPKLREIFENRPRVNVFWVELANLARDMTRQK